MYGGSKVAISLPLESSPPTLMEKSLADVDDIKKKRINIKLHMENAVAKVMSMNREPGIGPSSKKGGWGEQSKKC